MKPLQKNGHPLHHIGRGFYVLLDDRDVEVSDRAPGEVWIGFNPAAARGHLNGSMILIPDHTNADGLVPFDVRAGRAVWLAYGLDPDEIIHRQIIAGGVPAGGKYLVDWNPMLDVMA